MKKKIWLIGGLLILLVLIIWGVVWGPQTFSFYWYEYLNRKHLAEFEAAVEKTHGDNEHWRYSRAVIAAAKAWQP